jgi:hypothetical protein
MVQSQIGELFPLMQFQQQTKHLLIPTTVRNLGCSVRMRWMKVIQDTRVITNDPKEDTRVIMNDPGSCKRHIRERATCAAGFKLRYIHVTKIFKTPMSKSPYVGSDKPHYRRQDIWRKIFWSTTDLHPTYSLKLIGFPICTTPCRSKFPVPPIPQKVWKNKKKF